MACFFSVAKNDDTVFYEPESEEVTDAVDEEWNENIQEDEETFPVIRRRRSRSVGSMPLLFRKPEVVTSSQRYEWFKENVFFLQFLWILEN